GKIYLAGGVTGGWSYGGATLSSVNVYDPGTDTWTNAARLKDSLHSLGLTAAPDGYLYAVGGGLVWYSMVAAERYDPLADTWTYLPDAFHDYERAGAAAVYTSGRLFLVGGTSRVYEVTTSSVESLRLFDDFCRSGLQSEPDAIAPGERITYTIQLRSGDVTLTAASLTDPLPAGTAFGGFEQQPPGASYDAAQSRVEWSGDLQAHQAPITIQFGVVAAEAGWVSGQLITNTVAFSDGVGLTFDRSSVTRLEFFDLSPSAKRVHPLETPFGGSLTYTLRVQNGSSHTGTASLVDPIPLNASFISDSLTASAGSASYAGGSVVWSGELPQWTTHTNTSGDYEWGDSRGGGTLPGVKYEWIEISETGRQMGFYSPNYGRCYPVPFPFGFNFYGTHYSESAVQIDGTLFFMQPNEGLYMGPNNTPIPSATGYSGNRFIAAFWDDLYLAPGGLYYQVLGTPPRRRVVIEYHETSRLDGSRHLGTPGDWEIVLYEGSSIILLQYKDVDFGIPAYDHGASATIGIQDTPSHGLQYSYNTPALSNGLAILFLPPGKSVPYPIDHADIRFAVRTASPLADRTPITNTATITDGSGRLIARQAVALARGPDMASSFQTIEPSAPYPGDEVSVTLYVRNSGALDGEALVSDAIPDGLSYVKNSLSWETGFGRVVNGLLTWTGNIWAGTQSPVRFRAKVAGNATHDLVITNTAVVTNVFAGISHPAQASVTVQKPADVYVGQVGAGTLEWPETLVYTITYGNAGPFGTDLPVSIVDRLPADAIYVGSSPGGMYDSLARTLTWDVGALASGATGALTATLDVPAGVPPLSVLANAVSVEVLAQDANAANDAQDWFTVVGSPVNLLNYTAKTLAPQAINPGSVVSYTIVIANTGRASAAARITDTLPAGASYVPGSSWLEFAWNRIELYNPAGNRIEWGGEAPAGGTARLGFQAIITAASGSRVTNTVTIDDGECLVFERRVTTPPVRRVSFLPLIVKQK
ncbi:MAG TPA: hypothetical protein VJ754_01030, partial [Anaerolineae bacterium]|nr:hypothetical protein [Anaerolineae bacterium]